jgi:hypothetical protein
MSIEESKNRLKSKSILVNSIQINHRKSCQIDGMNLRHDHSIDHKKQTLEEKSVENLSHDIFKEIASEIRSSIKYTKRRFSMENLNDNFLDSLTNCKVEKRKLNILENELLNSTCQNRDYSTNRNSIKSGKNKNQEKSILDLTNFLFSKTCDLDYLDDVFNNKKQSDHSFYNRQCENREKEKQKSQLLYFQKRQEEMDKLRDRPEIDQGSKKIIQGKSIEPIYKRTNMVIENKKRKLEELKTKVYETNKINKPDNYIVQITPKYDNEKFNIWLENNKKIQTKIEEQLQKKRDENKHKEIEPSFTPEIDKNSKKIVKKKKNEGKTYEKLYKDSIIKTVKLQEKIRDSTPNFTPFTNKNLPKYLTKSKKSCDNLKENNNIMGRNCKDTLKLSTISTTKNGLGNHFKLDLSIKNNLGTRTKSDRNTIDNDFYSNDVKSNALYSLINEKGQIMSERKIISGYRIEKTNLESNYKNKMDLNSVSNVNKENNIRFYYSMKN